MPEPAPQLVRVVRGYPEPDEVAALVAVLTAVAQAAAGQAEQAAQAAARDRAGAGRAPAGAHLNRYQSPTSWQTS